MDFLLPTPNPIPKKYKLPQTQVSFASQISLRQTADQCWDIIEQLFSDTCRSFVDFYKLQPIDKCGYLKPFTFAIMLIAEITWINDILNQMSNRQMDTCKEIYRSFCYNYTMSYLWLSHIVQEQYRDRYSMVWLEIGTGTSTGPCTSPSPVSPPSTPGPIPVQCE